MSRGQRIYNRISTDSCLAVYCGWIATTCTRSLRAGSSKARTLPPAVATTCSSSSRNTRVCCCARSSLYGFTAKRQALEGTHARRVRLSWKGNITCDCLVTAPFRRKNTLLPAAFVAMALPEAAWRHGRRPCWRRVLCPGPARRAYCLP